MVEYFEQQADWADIEEKLANQGEVVRGGISRIYLSLLKSGNHATEPSTVGNVISQWHWKSTFDFVKNCKEQRVKARHSMPNSEIYSPIFYAVVHTILKIFSQHGLRKCR